MNLRNASMLFLRSLLVIVAITSSTATAQETLGEEVLLPLVEDRGKARTYVELLHSLNVTKIEYRQCKVLYGETKAKYEAWAAAVSLAIEKDSLGKLRKASAFKKSCSETRQAGDALARYVKALQLRQDREESTIGLPMLSGVSRSGKLNGFRNLGEWVGKIAEMFEDLRKKHYEANVARAQAEKAWLEVRQKIAEQFAAKAKWPTWDEIVASLQR